MAILVSNLNNMKTQCKIDSHIPQENGEFCECCYFRKSKHGLEEWKFLRDTVSNFRNFKNDVKTIVIEDIPHAYQDRLLEILK